MGKIRDGVWRGKAVRNSHTGRQTEKLNVIKREETQYCLNMGLVAHVLRQSLQGDIYSVALGCSNPTCILTAGQPQREVDVRLSKRFLGERVT